MSLVTLTGAVKPHTSINLHRNGETWTVTAEVKGSTQTYGSTGRSLSLACYEVWEQLHDAGQLTTPGGGT